MTERYMTEPITFMGLKVSTMVWGLIGGATAAAFGPGSLLVRFFIACVGTVSAVAFGPIWSNIAFNLLNQRFTVPANDIEPAVHFLCGLTGMLVCGSLVEFFKRMRSRAPDVADDVVDHHIQGRGKRKK